MKTFDEFLADAVMVGDLNDAAKDSDFSRTPEPGFYFPVSHMWICCTDDCKQLHVYFMGEAKSFEFTEFREAARWLYDALVEEGTI